MKIAYLMDQHPYISSPFIRREIAGLEDLGIEVARFAIRHPEFELVDDADKRELEKTRFILAIGPFSLLFNLLSVAVTRPLRFVRATSLTLTIAWKSDRLVRHLAYLAEACVLLRWLSKSEASHVHAHFAQNATTVAMLCHELGGPRFSFTVHGPLEFDQPRQITLPEKIRRSAFVATISSFARSQLYRWCEQEHWSKIHEIHCCVDDNFLRAAPQSVSDEPRFVCVGGLCEQKGQLLLVEAAAQLANEGQHFTLVLVGDGPLRNEIEALTVRLGIEDRIELAGWASGPEVKKQLLASRVVVLPSFAEGLPVVIMEALALRRPVISTYIAGIPELVVPGSCGWLIPAGSVTDLVDCMREALSTPIDRLNDMGEVGAARVAQRHNVAKEAEKLKNLFKESAEHKYH